MKKEKLKNMLMPVGLLCVTGLSFVGHFVKVEMSDAADGFLKGIGIGLMLCAVFMQRCAKTLPNSGNKTKMG